MSGRIVATSLYCLRVSVFVSFRNGVEIEKDFVIRVDRVGDNSSVSLQ